MTMWIRIRGPVLLERGCEVDTSGYIMPPKCQLSLQDIDGIIAGSDQVNALRILSKKFKIGQGRIRRIWAGAAYREIQREKQVLVQLTD